MTQLDDAATADAVVAYLAGVTSAELFDRRLRAFGAAIRGRRRELALSQDRLADLAGVARRTVYRLELGHHVPSLRTVWLLADALTLDASALLWRANPAYGVATRPGTLDAEPRNEEIRSDVTDQST